jgi:hypothetical protein
MNERICSATITPVLIELAPILLTSRIARLAKSPSQHFRVAICCHQHLRRT